MVVQPGQEKAEGRGFSGPFNIERTPTRKMRENLVARPVEFTPLQGVMVLK